MGICIPPPTLLPRVLEKTQCELILIAPHWPQAIWFPLLLGDVSTTSTPDTQHSLVTIPASRSDPSLYVQFPATRVESIRDALCSRGFSVDVASRVSRPQRESSMTIYESMWRIFTDWCKIQHINLLSASENVVLEFLLHLHTEKHLAISTIAGYQMLITSTEIAASIYRNRTGATSNFIFQSGILP